MALGNEAPIACCLTVLELLPIVLAGALGTRVPKSRVCLNPVLFRSVQLDDSVNTGRPEHVGARAVALKVVGSVVRACRDNILNLQILLITLLVRTVLKFHFLTLCATQGVDWLIVVVVVDVLVRPILMTADVLTHGYL